MRRLIMAAALTAAGLAAVACSSGSSGRQVASLSGHSRASGSAPRFTVAQGDRDFVNFARCMRAHGVQMSDPFHVPGHQGLSINLPTRDAATRAAYAACTHFIQPVINMKNAGATTAMSPARLAALTRYAQCMRAHDIPMLDPTSFGALDLGNVPGITSGFGRYSPQFRSADAACRHLLPAGTRDNGSGP